MYVCTCTCIMYILHVIVEYTVHTCINLSPKKNC